MNLLRRGAERAVLTPDELGASAVMAALAAGATIVATVIPVLAAAQLVAVVPYGIVAHRHRLRAVVAAIVAGTLLAGLIAGLSAALGLLLCALLGGFVGDFKRRGWGVGAVWLCSAVLGPLAAATTVGVLAIFGSYRRLVFKAFRSTVKGFARLLDHVSGLHGAARWLNHAVDNLIAHWPWVVGGVVLVVTVALLFVSWLLIGQVLERLQWVGESKLKLAPAGASGQGNAATGLAPAPLPVLLHEASVTYGSNTALDRVSLELRAGEFVAVTGDNGSGKSTLARLLAGAEPSSGTVERAGAVGLGKAGGTAFITQRPDAQVVGLRVRDDILWGLADDHGVDVDGVLEQVGLARMADRDTGTLSGGQLQRLAIAAALARKPSLLISDESTAMVDPSGRAQLMSVLAELPRRLGITVVHITHYDEEAAAADRVILLRAGRVVDEGAATDGASIGPLVAADSSYSPGDGAVVDRGVVSVAMGSAPTADPSSDRSATDTGADTANDTNTKTDYDRPALEIRDLYYNYGHGTVWEHRALQDLTLTAKSGEGLLIVGENGSGKSTLAWLVAGLLKPTAGSCLIAGEDAEARRGAVGIAFQHARLQLQRPTVRAEIIDAAGWSEYVRLEGRDSWRQREEKRAAERALARQLDRQVADALKVVGLPVSLAPRSIEELSGGQQRRLAIAGLLARDPRVLVLDEPLAGLDEPSRAGLVALLARLRANNSLTLIVVTHDPEPLVEACPRTIRLEGGRLVEDSGDAVGGPVLIGRAR